jgi:hypothetical protein
MLSKLKLYTKNLIGWSTKRKLLVIAVDDYGNVRLASKKARQFLDSKGLKLNNRFDAYDTLETIEDLEMLFSVLRSVKDKNGKHAVFSPLSMACNLNFEAVRANGVTEVVLETVLDTYNRIKVSEGNTELIRQGIKEGIYAPEYHGREHFNMHHFKQLLNERNPELLANIEVESLTSISSKPFSEINFTGAYKFQKFSENESLKEILKDGLVKFEQVYGYKARLFNAPGGNEHKTLHQALSESGIEFIETKLLKKEHQGDGKYKTIFQFNGQAGPYNQTLMVRNCVFEPGENVGINWVDFAMKQVDAAFTLNKPAYISSHRVNFCGLIDTENRKKGLNALKSLLSKVVKKYPDVEFVSVLELGRIMKKTKQI